MSLLKDGDGVNFQKASCTLDGCVKIYTNRVDSVATETGKLLSGLTDSGNKKRRGEDDNGNEEGQEGEGDEAEEDEGEDENGVRKRTKKRVSSMSCGMIDVKYADWRIGPTVNWSHSGNHICATTAEEV